MSLIVMSALLQLPEPPGIFLRRLQANLTMNSGAAVERGLLAGVQSVIVHRSTVDHVRPHASRGACTRTSLPHPCDRGAHRARVTPGPAARFDLDDEVADDAVEEIGVLEVDGVAA